MSERKARPYQQPGVPGWKPDLSRQTVGSQRPPLSRVSTPRRTDHTRGLKVAAGAFGFLWVIALVLSLATAGLVVYGLWEGIQYLQRN